MHDMLHTVCLAAAALCTWLGMSLANSLGWQIHLPGGLTCRADSLAWQTHLLGRLAFSAD